MFRDRDSARGSCACGWADGLSRHSREARLRARDSPVNRLCFARHACDGDGVHVVRVKGLGRVLAVVRVVDALLLVEVGEQAGEGTVHSAERVRKYHDDRVLLLVDRIGVVANARLDAALAGGMVEGWVGGRAAAASAVDFNEQLLLAAAEGHEVAHRRRGRAAFLGRAVAERVVSLERGIALGLVEDVVAVGGGMLVDDVRENSPLY